MRYPDFIGVFGCPFLIFSFLHSTFGVEFLHFIHNRGSLFEWWQSYLFFSAVFSFTVIFFSVFLSSHARTEKWDRKMEILLCSASWM